MALSEALAVDRALTFLAGEQLASGRFPMGQIHLDKIDADTGSRVVVPERSCFGSAHIAHSLSWCDDERARAMIERTLTFFRNEQVGGGVWRFWCRDYERHGEIPPDADDTACISEVLRRLGGGAPDNEAFLLGNRNARGLFFTWMIPRITSRANARWWRMVLRDVTWGRLVKFWRTAAAHDDVDPVVNANVLLYLGERAETEATIRWLLGACREGKEDTDKWYQSKYPFYYAVSRCYASGIARLDEAGPAMRRALAADTRADGRIGENALETAMALCAIMNFGLALAEYRRSVEYVLETQSADGGWELYPAWYDGAARPSIAFGSRAETTGFCLEALARASALQPQLIDKGTSSGSGR